MRSPTIQRIMDEMEKDSWWVKLKRTLKIKWWVFKCLTRKYWDKEFINRRDHIAHWTIRKGTILRVFPDEGSEKNKPYKVVVTYSNNHQFIISLHNKPYQYFKQFYYDSYEWKNYHYYKFQILKY